MMRELEIERQFDLKIEKMQPNKGIYFLNTNKGKKCLKRINYGVQKLSFIYGAKEHLIKNGFNKIDKNLLNTEGNPYALVNEDIYVLSDWIEGRECDFHNDEDLVMAAKTLAELHIASIGYQPEENSKLKSDLGRWPHLMEKRVSGFNKMKNMVRKKKNKKTDFDIMYINTMDYYKDYGLRAMKVLENSKYDELCEEAELQKSFCHHDYTYHNIIVSPENEIHVVDFDYCKRELRAYDISNFLIKVLKRRSWDIKYAKLILDTYNSVSPLKEEEYRIIFSFLLFPQRFWRLSNRYYYNETGWIQNTFNNKIQSMIKEQEVFDKFIEEFKELYNQTE
ncbi:spore coat protein I [Clostridium collagenovorans DSM 3089]|uniref:Spore coat protein I n=1 Tax=Clostridium collagenovorans DSM 3089 TaxID=1121306 RepID=A0A1M5W457_9CLOT|nr:CotS family spore coat protein [Clostridium collagenovorans]SHH82240.1 spore coat protein I [Clostridium collagenovorans DSM 3089]